MARRALTQAEFADLMAKRPPAVSEADLTAALRAKYDLPGTRAAIVPPTGYVGRR